MYALRTLAYTSAFGFGIATLAVLGGVALGRPPRGVNSIVFSLGALVFGFGLASWASALLFGASLDRTASLADLGTDWSSEAMADAMSLLTAFGGGMMVGGTISTELVVRVV